MIESIAGSRQFECVYVWCVGGVQPSPLCPMLPDGSCATERLSPAACQRIWDLGNQAALSALMVSSCSTLSKTFPLAKTGIHYTCVSKLCTNEERCVWGLELPLSVGGSNTDSVGVYGGWRQRDTPRYFDGYGLGLPECSVTLQLSLSYKVCLPRVLFSPTSPVLVG